MSDANGFSRADMELVFKCGGLVKQILDGMEKSVAASNQISDAMQKLHDLGADDLGIFQSTSLDELSTSMKSLADKTHMLLLRLREHYIDF